MRYGRRHITGIPLPSPIEIVRPTEKIYLFKIAHDLGFDKEAIKELLDESK